MKFVISVALICMLLPIVFLIAFTPEPCEHEDMVTMYSFASNESTEHSYARKYCRDCDKKFRCRLFQGELVDQSYLSTIEEHTDVKEITHGEYYTVRTEVTSKFYNINPSDKVRIGCKAENDDFIVYFGVEFKEEFREQVALIKTGDEITFRGRFYDKGCGFTDCELIE